MSFKEISERWEALITLKNASGVVIEEETKVGSVTRTVFVMVKPEGKIPDHYNATRLPKYRAMTRRERRM